MGRLSSGEAAMLAYTRVLRPGRSPQLRSLGLHPINCTKHSVCESQDHFFSRFLKRKIPSSLMSQPIFSICFSRSQHFLGLLRNRLVKVRSAMLHSMPDRLHQLYDIFAAIVVGCFNTKSANFGQICQILEGSFSAVSKPFFASK